MGRGALGWSEAGKGAEVEWGVAGRCIAGWGGMKWDGVGWGGAGQPGEEREEVEMHGVSVCRRGGVWIRVELDGELGGRKTVCTGGVNRRCAPEV